VNDITYFGFAIVVAR